ncbi:MAG: glycosyltransferase family 2 protein [Mucilaginibacter sp.]
MIPVSVVIITKNEAEVIAKSINAARLITDDIIVIDNDSDDDTEGIALSNGCRVYQKAWGGYGANKNKGVELARHDWILSIDADEIPDVELVLAMYDLKLEDENVVYDLKFRSYFGKKRIRFGNWGRDHHIRLFNRRQVRWSEPLVHETLVLPKHIKTEILTGHINHYSVKDNLECVNKAVYYAKLSASKYYQSGKKANLVNMYLSPLFSFFKNYILLLGFLDGREGWDIAKTIYKNRWLKYHYLNQLEGADKKKEYVKHDLAVEY